MLAAAFGRLSSRTSRTTLMSTNTFVIGTSASDVVCTIALQRS
jgi:hypothetical protein